MAKAAAVPAPVSEETGALLPVLQNYKIAKYDPKAIAEVLRANAGGMQLTRFDLPTIKMPTGGGLAFTVTTASGPRPEGEIEGIIVDHQVQRAYWEIDFDESGGGTPPDCSSGNGEVGQGKPGGQCSRCPLSAFATAMKKGVQGRGQACKQITCVYVVRPGSTIPTVIPLPPTSQKPFKQYMIALANEGIGFFATTTKFSLKQAQNKEGVKYSEVVLTKGDELSDHEVNSVVRPIRDVVAGLVRTVDLSDFQNVA